MNRETPTLPAGEEKTLFPGPGPQPSRWGWATTAAAALSLLMFAFFASLIPSVAGGEALRWALPWVPSLGVELAFLVDGLSLTFALLITGIGALVLLYSGSYLQGHPQLGRFALILTAFLLSMLGLVLADDLVALFVFWELTTITSYLLIGFDNDSAKARRSALQALLVTGGGGLAFLAGAILIGTVAGTYSISGLLSQGEVLREHALYVPILILVLLGAFTKSAQVPFHFWLPNAMAAPTPVSAFLHSATMVKAGVYLLARLHPSLGGTEIWLWTLTIAGSVTAVFASLMAVRQTDLKLALAYTTLMALGALTLLLAGESSYTLTAFVTFLLAHSLYKAALFLSVGCIDHEAGTRDATILGGLGRAMPVTAVAAGVAALSMAGFPPLIGFIGKELKYAGALAMASEPWFVLGALVLSNALMVTVAGIVAFRPFWRPARGPLPRTPHEAPWPMLAGPVTLAALGALFGLAPALLQGPLVGPAVATFLGSPDEAATLTLWAGVNLPLLLSLATFALGLALYAMHRPLRDLLARLGSRSPSFDAGWDRLMDGVLGFATWQARLLQTGQLRRYLVVVLATAATAVGGTLLAKGTWAPPVGLGAVGWLEAAPVALILSGTGIAALTSSRVAAVAGLGVVGVGVALVFILFGAPDVAITQLLVETLTVVLVAVALLRLPQLAPDWRPGHAFLAIGVGAAVSATLLAVLAQPFDRRLTTWFETTSWPEAYGRNIVNVILVDFRALDTFGEVAVVAVAAVSALALIRAGRSAR